MTHLCVCVCGGGLYVKTGRVEARVQSNSMFVCVFVHVRAGLCLCDVVHTSSTVGGECIRVRCVSVHVLSIHLFM